jgi:hypothetical protein
MAEIVTVVVEPTPFVVIGKVALAEPAGTVTVAGTVAADVLLLCRLTDTPPVGATPVRLTVPVEPLPPTTELGFLVTDDKVGAFTVRVLVLVTP